MLCCLPCPTLLRFPLFIKQIFLANVVLVLYLVVACKCIVAQVMLCHGGTLSMPMVSLQRLPLLGGGGGGIMFVMV